MKQLITILLTLVLVSSGWAYSGTVSVDSTSAVPGSAVTLAVRMSGNDIKLSALKIPLKYDASVLHLDSVSFVSTLKPDDINGYYLDSAAGNKVTIVYVPDISKSPIDTIIASSGVLAYIHFHVVMTATSQFSKVDSLNMDELIGTVHFWTRLDFADNTGMGVYLPAFTPGGVTVLVPTGVDETNSNTLPDSYALDQNYPNPFNPSTSIRFDLPKPGHARLEVYNLLGQSVGVLAEGRYPAGTTQVVFSGDNLPSGIYFYRLSYEGGALTRKMILLK